ncbi:MAG TPA: sulfatase-like hydrolase/transferase, partial [Myxococcota bacterium]|nr:sulfatase-like hydrolase/transferase [Myxococcota bacterium]
MTSGPPATRAAASLACLALLLLGVAARPQDAKPDGSGAPAAADLAKPDARPNLLLITLDTMRADEIAPWGPGGVATNLDALAAESLVALDAHAPAPLTFPSHASMLTGLYPFAHGVRDNDLYQLDRSAQTTAKLLKEAGWRTEAVLAASVLRANTGLDEGFESYFDVKYLHARNVPVNAQRRANEVSELVLERLAVADPRPWFLWMHYFDAHLPYDAAGGPPKTAPLREQYDAEVRFIDRELGRVLARLRESGALARTWIVVCGDHGEGLRIQQESSHSYLAEEGTLRIPLFVRAPDGALRGRLAAPASAVDVHPTLIAIAGLPLPGAVHGRDLLAAFQAEQRGGAEAEAQADRTIWFETWAGWHVYGWSRLDGVIAGRFKYVRNLKDELFDVTGPVTAELESQNLAAQRPEVLRALKLRYDAIQQEPVAKLASARPNLPPEEISRLMELGYLARSIGDDDTSKNGTLDPREHYTTALDIEWAIEEAAAGRFDGPVKVLEALVKKYPQSAVYREILGKVLMQGNRQPEAARVFREALAIDPDLVSANFYLGVMLRLQKEYNAARRHLEKTIALSPVHLEGWLQLRALHNATA